MRASRVIVCLLSGGVAAIVACGDDGGANKLPDAPPGGSDGAMPDAPDTPAAARLTITRDGSGVEGVNVYFQNADSSLVAKVPTDVNGIAEAVVAPNAFVTVVNPFTVVAGVRQDEIKTIAGVQPGDRLTLTQNNQRSAVTFMNVIADAHLNASSHALWTNCLEMNSKGGNPQFMSLGSGSMDRPQVSLDFECTTTADVLIESEDGSGSSMGWVFVDNAPLTAAGTMDITGAYTDSAQVSAAFNDVPDGITFIDAASYLATSDGLVWRETSGLGVGSNSASWSFSRPVPANTTQIWHSSFGGTSYGQQQVIDWKPIADPATFTFANTLLRGFTSDAQFDIATHTITWTEEAAGAIPDLAVADITGSRNRPTLLDWRWTVAGVPSGASLVYPVLPNDIAQYNAITGDFVYTENLTTAKVPGGYNAVRPGVLSIEGPLTLVVGATGRIVMQSSFGQVRAAAPAPRLHKRASTATRTR
ncbi:MAG: hypothetical protein ACKV2T_03675 [Kofleriaceae bacterium]